MAGEKGNGHACIAAKITGILLIAGFSLALILLLRPGRNVQVTMPEATPGPAEEAGPLNGWVILVDPGHGGYDGGARAQSSGRWEKEITLATALQVEKSLQKYGATVIMTRREDIDLTSPERPSAVTKKRQDMQARIDMAISGEADMVLSVHMNEYRDRRESGPQVFYRQGSDAGRLLAGCLQEALIEYLKPEKKRSALPGDYFILQLDVPSALIECGFISNPQEEKKLLNEEYQALIGEAVAQGVAEYVFLTHQP